MNIAGQNLSELAIHGWATLYRLLSHAMLYWLDDPAILAMAFC